MSHIGRYRLTLRRVLDAAFFASNRSGCGNVLDRLLTLGLVQSRVLSGRLCYYQLTAQGATDRFPVSRTRRLGPRQLRHALAILWFCHMQGQRRVRLEPEELAQRLPAAPARPHCLEAGKRLRLHQVRVPGAHTQLGSAISELRECVRQAAADPTLAAWMRSREYRFALLVDPARVARMRAAVQRTGLADTVSVEGVEGLKLLQPQRQDL